MCGSEVTSPLFNLRENNFGLILSAAHLIKKLSSDLPIIAPNEKKEEFALSMIGNVVKILGADEKENDKTIDEIIGELIDRYKKNK